MVGSGIFMTTGKIGPLLQSPNLVYGAWIAGGIFAFCGALCYAELGAMLPQSGGNYIFAKRAYGARIGAFVGLEAMLIAFPATLAVIALVFGEYLSSVVAGLEVTATALIALTLVTTFHCKSLALGSRLNTAAAFVKVGLLLAFAFYGLHLSSSTSEAIPQFVKSNSPAPGWFSSEFASAVIIVSFAFVGWNNITMLGGEVKRPQRNLPLSLLLGVGLVTGLYLLVNMMFMQVVQPNEMVDANGQATNAIAYLVGDRIFSKWLVNALGWTIGFIVLSTLLSVTMAGGRMASSMAEARQLPRLFGKFNRGGSPANALILQLAISLTLCLAFNIEQLLILSGLTGMLSAIVVTSSVLALRRSAAELPRAFRIPWYPLPALIAIGIAAWIMVQTAIGNPLELIVSILLITVLFLLALLKTRKSS